MNAPALKSEGNGNLSDAARRRLLSRKGEPLFYSDWLRAVFIHFEVDAELLQCSIPFPLDLRDGKAYVSLVAFTMKELRPCWGGRATAWLFAPIATHGLLNVRTYVRHEGEPGIYFISEWIPNRLSELVGPHTFGLPYRHGQLRYEHQAETGMLKGTVTAGPNALAYEAGINANIKFVSCPANSLEEFFIERYTAFTSRGSHRRYFRIWHPPWLQTKIDLRICNDSLLIKNFPWYRTAKFVGANYAPGAACVWMGRPHRIAKPNPFLRPVALAPA
ncbi:MAG: hypothetical protein JWR19_4448 [Pedosphaera sp.]|nr:hypothetical protein [Pedosphaera sp.]